MSARATMAVLAVCLGITTEGRVAAQGSGHTEPPRLVLVELFTSQGCDMCPEAERLLGVVAANDPRVVPVAFHVDYFNDPWKDPFSDPLYSLRQGAYNLLYRKPKPAEYGLYYTPMVMVDGIQSENGRDLAGIQAAVRAARSRKPLAELETSLKHHDGGRSGDLTVRVHSRSARLKGREVLVCAVLRDDRVTTRVGSGENANKTLVARFPARLTRFEFVTLDRDSPQSLSFDIALDPAWKTGNLDLVVFAQDRKSGEVYQTVRVPWQPSRAR